MLTRLFGTGRTSGATEKLSPTGWPGVGYGSCPTTSTLTSASGRWNARRMWSPAGRYDRPAAISARRNAPIRAIWSSTGASAAAQSGATSPRSTRLARVLTGHMFTYPGFLTPRSEHWSGRQPGRESDAHPHRPRQPVEERRQQRLPQRRLGEVEQGVDLGHRVREPDAALAAHADRGEQAVEVVVGQGGRVEGADELDDPGVDRDRAGRDGRRDRRSAAPPGTPRPAARWPRRARGGRSGATRGTRAAAAPTSRPRSSRR